MPREKKQVSDVTAAMAVRKTQWLSPSGCQPGGWDTACVTTVGITAGEGGQRWNQGRREAAGENEQRLQAGKGVGLE